MVAALPGQEEESRFQNVDAGAWRNGVEELHLHSVHILLGEVQRKLVKVTVLTLQHEEECLVVENGVRSHEKSARLVVSAPQRNVANSFLVVRLFVNYEILADDDYAAWADIARDLDQHVCRLVDREYILSDHMVQTKVHLVHRKSFLKVSSIDRTKVLV